jgi:hypothetical protein
MTVRVRSAEGGELEYASVAAVRQALAVGLVSPDDEALVPGASGWQRAGDLVGPAAGGRRPGWSVRAWALLGVAGAVGALALLRSPRLELQVAGAALAFGLASTMFAFTTRAFRRRGR